MDNLTDELIDLLTDPAWGVLLGALVATLIFCVSQPVITRVAKMRDDQSTLRFID